MRDPNEVSIQYMKGVGPSRKRLFANLGIETIEDLLYFFPRRYEDRRQMTPLSNLREGEWQTVTGKVLSQNSRQAYFHKKHVSEVVLTDGKNKLFGVWFNQPYIAQYFQQGARAVLYGKVDRYKERLQMVSPEYEILDEQEEGENLSTGRIVPVYPLTRGVTQRALRRMIRSALGQYAAALKDFLPFDIRERHQLMNFVKGLNNLHFPESFEMQKDAYKRISFEEFFFFQVSVLLRKSSVVQKKGVAHRIRPALCEEFSNAFPFTLTSAQQRVIGEMRADMASGSPMHRLLQGDVGSGKTLVAFFGCVVARENGCQSAIMAPTEILAKQHFDTLTAMKAGKESFLKDMRMVFLSSDVKKKEKAEIYRKVAAGEIDLVVGTHALIQEGLTFKNLSFVVIDEQHKFGVRQRALLSAKGFNPDCLIMTATPIPRTLCLTLYGDLDVSILDELPPGRGETKTILFKEEEAAKAYRFVYEMIRLGRQAYIVYPIVEESENLDLKAAEKMFARLKDKEFKGLRLGLVHGQMKRKDAQAIMDQFKEGKIDVLVSTTVLEVGIDVSNATVMVIEHADRFGLSQLHQLRGRIGRGAVNSTCMLIATPAAPESAARIEAILSTTDGFKIAEKDLLIRGPGEFFGRHQHGLNELKIANPVTQIDILEKAREEATALIHADFRLETADHAKIRTVIEKRYPTYLAMARAG